jgi:hypothetical protein
MAPLRTFSTFASAAAIFVFVASAVISSFPRMTSTAGAPAAAPAATAALDQAKGGATSAPAAPQSSVDLQDRSPSSASSSPGAAFNLLPSPTPAPAEKSASDAAGRQNVASASASTSEFRVAERLKAPEQAPFNPFPWLWLVLGLVFAAVSFILGRRLRSA